MRRNRKTHWPVRPGLAWPLLLVGFLILVACGEKTPPSTPLQRPRVAGLQVTTLALVPVEESVSAAGTVKASRVSAVAARVMGVVTGLLVREGDRVEKGQLLLTLDDRDATQRLKAAEAGHREAEKALASARQNLALTDLTIGRYQKLFEEKAISRQEMDQFETQGRVARFEQERVEEMVRRAEAGLAEARIYLEFTRVTAPVAGLVTEKRIEVGSMAVPGAPLLTLESAGSYVAEIAVDEGFSGRLKTGGAVRVAIESLGLERQGRITEILPSVDPLSRSLTVKVALEAPGLRSGLFARVLIPKGAREALLAPRAAVVNKGQLTGVYVVDGQGVLSYRLVRLGRDYQGQWEILSGLQAGEQIVVAGADKAVDGGVLAR